MRENSGFQFGSLFNAHENYKKQNSNLFSTQVIKNQPSKFLVQNKNYSSSVCDVSKSSQDLRQGESQNLSNVLNQSRSQRFFSAIRAGTRNNQSTSNIQQSSFVNKNIRGNSYFDPPDQGFGSEERGSNKMTRAQNFFSLFHNKDLSTSSINNNSRISKIIKISFEQFLLEEKENQQLSDLIKQSTFEKELQYETKVQVKQVDLPESSTFIKKPQKLEQLSQKGQVIKTEKLEQSQLKKQTKVQDKQTTKQKMQKTSEAEKENRENNCVNSQGGQKNINQPSSSHISDNLNSEVEYSNIREHPAQDRQSNADKSHIKQQIYSLILEGSLLQIEADSSEESSEDDEEQNKQSQNNQLRELVEVHQETKFMKKKQNQPELQKCFVQNKMKGLPEPLCNSELKKQKLTNQQNEQDDWVSEASDNGKEKKQEKQQEEEQWQEQEEEEEEEEEEVSNEAQQVHSQQIRDITFEQNQQVCIGLYAYNTLSEQKIGEVYEIISKHYLSTQKFNATTRKIILSLIQGFVLETRKFRQISQEQMSQKYRNNMDTFIGLQNISQQAFKKQFKKEFKSLGFDIITYFRIHQTKANSILQIVNQYSNKAYFHVDKRRFIFSELQNLMKLVKKTRENIKKIEAFRKIQEQSEGQSDQEYNQQDSVVDEDQQSRDDESEQLNLQNEVSILSLSNLQSTIPRLRVDDSNFPSFISDRQTEASTIIQRNNREQQSQISELQDLKLFEGGKCLIQCLSGAKIQSLQSIIGQYNSSNYFHVGPRRQILGFIEAFATKLSTIWNKSMISSIPKSESNEKLINLGRKLRKYFTVNKISSIKQTASSYYPSNYFHVAPRYAIFSDVQQAIRIYQQFR